MEGANLDCEQFKCCKLPHIKVWSQTKYARSHVSPTLISVRDLLQKSTFRQPIHHSKFALHIKFNSPSFCPRSHHHTKQHHTMPFHSIHLVAAHTPPCKLFEKIPMET